MTAIYKNVLKGQCHCGQLTFELHTNKDEADLVPRTCQCPFCISHGASWISDPQGEAYIHYDDKNKVSFYRFALRTADFFVCRDCGVAVTAVCEIKNRNRCVLNVKAMPNHSFASEPALTNFENENVESRLARRERNWTGNTILPEGYKAS